LSRLVFEAILNEVLSGVGFAVKLVDRDKEQLYLELLYYFGLVGGLNICQALETAWRDPYNKVEIKEFITAWLRKKTRKVIRATGLI
jgi:hypothetical protein